MNAGVAGEIGGQGDGAEIFDLQAAKRVKVHFETAQVVGKNQNAPGGQQFCHRLQQANMVTLNIEIVAHAL